MAETAQANEVVRNPNEIRDLIYTSLALAEYTKIPILFLGNPGIAKTTGVRCWAKAFGYEVTTLIGTQRVAEEILGYMVNDTGEKRLVTYTPDWFDEIQENSKNGMRTLLFVDELSQAPDNVQGAMLQLIFDRKVGGKKNFLPEDCLVVSAANYKGNIPPQCGIQAPTLNRFAIINVMPTDGFGLIEEFLQDEDERELRFPIFQNTKITKEIENTVRNEMKAVLKLLVETYSRVENEGSVIDFQNTQLNEIFDKPGKIYNFISGRTISYLYRAAVGMIHLGIVRKVHKTFIRELVLGLGGLGTNNLDSDKKREEFETSLIGGFQKVLRRSVESNVIDINGKELDFTNKTVDKSISEWMRYSESKSIINDTNLNRLVNKIAEEYSTKVEKMEEKVKNWNSILILTDLQKISSLLGFLKQQQMVNIIPFIKTIEIIDATWEAYKVSILDSLKNN